ncbi:hypothetical protein KI387_039405 [Taxus chinensis]|uniref:Annexin n=1 Tax=Taxus chinensis TaxID=29808 RepID=A0AA38C897_TAXCH|nr:hypothetical protein KI387_039405 [Taxus chinensis]
MAACAVSCCPNLIAKDCEELHRAFKGLGADQGKIVEILGSKNAKERKEIRETYCAMYKEDLCRRLEKELHGKLEKAVVLWMREQAERDAIIAGTALEGWSTDNRALSEVICTRSSAEIIKIREAYQTQYQRCLEDDVACKTSGPFQKLLLGLLKAHRCDCKAIDMNQAKCDAKRLYEAGEATCGTDEETFIQIMSQRSVMQLRATFGWYKQEYGHDIMKALKKQTQKEFEEAVRVTIKSMYAPAQYFAKVLHNAMKGFLNDDSAVARVLVTRAEADLKEINGAYERKYKMSIVQTLHQEMSGHFKNFCLALTAHPEPFKYCRIDHVTTMPIPPSHCIVYISLDTYDIGQSSASQSSSTTVSTPTISTYTTAIISPTISVPPSVPSPPVVAPSTTPPMVPPTNILDNAIQHDDVHTDDSEDSDDEVDAIELTDESLRQLDFTPLGVDDSYFEETFMANGPSEYRSKTPPSTNVMVLYQGSVNNVDAISSSPPWVAAPLPPFTCTLFINRTFWQHIPIDSMCLETICTCDSLARFDMTLNDILPPLHSPHLYHGYFHIMTTYGLCVFHLMVFVACTPCDSPLTLG